MGLAIIYGNLVIHPSPLPLAAKGEGGRRLRHRNCDSRTRHPQCADQNHHNYETRLNACTERDNSGSMRRVTR